jgi:hypothetical protein
MGLKILVAGVDAAVDTERNCLVSSAGMSVFAFGVENLSQIGLSDGDCRQGIVVDGRRLALGLGGKRAVVVYCW